MALGTIPVANGQLVEALTINTLGTAAVWYSADSGAVNASQVTFNGSAPNYNGLTALTNGQPILFIAAATNTSATTLQVIGSSGSLGAFPITKQGGTALAAGDIQVGQMVLAIYNAASSRFEMQSAPPPPAVTVPTPLFGNGADGTVNITSNTTLTRDMFYGQLTVQGGVTVYTNGFMIRCSGTFTNNGAIANSGAVGSNGLGNTTGQPGGIGAPAGTLGGGAAGGTGGNMAGNGVAGSPGDAGAAGGSGGNGHVTTGGTSDLNSLKLVNWARAMLGQAWLKPNLANLLEGGSGGGGGGGSANHGAPGGGGGGGVILVAALHVAGTGAVQVQGGAGGNGAASNNVGGGGGGGGGYALVITNDTSCSWSLSASGGAGGANTGTGTVGLAGTAGYTNVITGAVEV